MKLLILGATGPTGRQLVTQALDSGHSVAALVRDPKKLDERREIEVIHGDATDLTALATQCVDATRSLAHWALQNRSKAGS